jgi:hypothetical protein
MSDALASDQSTGEPIERVRWRGEVYALIVRAHLPRQGYNFVTDAKDELQLGVNHYAASTRIKPHYHLPLARQIAGTLEILHIDDGDTTLSLHDPEDGTRFYTTRLVAGDTVLLIRGGHGLEIHQPTRIIEVKQGPYLGPDKDKKEL